MSPEAVLAAGYAAFLIVAAALLEWLSVHTHKRSLRYRTAGFYYDAEHDHWLCPEGQHLWPEQLDSERRLMRYRAKAHLCNACALKAACTDSDEGREIVRALDPWPHSEAGRFHRAVSVLLIGVAVLVLVVGLARNHAPLEAAVLLGVLVVTLAAGRWFARDLRRHPSGFPEPTASPRLGDQRAGAGERPTAHSTASEIAPTSAISTNPSP
jgi:hypothetical protein